MKVIVTKSTKFGIRESYRIVRKKKGKTKLKYYNNPGLIERLHNTTAIKAKDDGNGVVLTVDGLCIELDYSQLELVRLMCIVLAEQEDSTLRDSIL